MGAIPSFKKWLDDLGTGTSRKLVKNVINMALVYSKDATYINKKKPSEIFLHFATSTVCGPSPFTDTGATSET